MDVDPATLKRFREEEPEDDGDDDEEGEEHDDEEVEPGGDDGDIEEDDANEEAKLAASLGSGGVVPSVALASPPLPPPKPLLQISAHTDVPPRTASKIKEICISNQNFSACNLNSESFAPRATIFFLVSHLCSSSFFCSKKKLS